jgi:hypothetical protein
MSTVDQMELRGLPEFLAHMRDWADEMFRGGEVARRAEIAFDVALAIVLPAYAPSDEVVPEIRALLERMA